MDLDCERLVLQLCLLREYWSPAGAGDSDKESVCVMQTICSETALSIKACGGLPDLLTDSVPYGGIALSGDQLCDSVSRMKI